MKRRMQHGSRGFTLIEMMVAITVMVILLGMAMPIYSGSIRRAREDNFHTNLETLNRVIYQYTLDKQKAPKSLDDLKAAGYIEKVPDDITGSNTWEVEEDETTIMAIGQTEGGVFAVKSGSSRTGSNGKPYNEW
ncbi:MAG: type II secretion system protein [Terriglobales bacterium]|jgi:general secretion pathway protein G